METAINMGEPSAFDQSKPKSPKAAAEARERMVQQKVRELMRCNDEADFIEGIRLLLQLAPGNPDYEAALAAWHEGKRRL